MLLLVTFYTTSCSVADELEVNFYHDICPEAEKLIVSKTVNKNHVIGAGLIRLQFHDCFVRGCDASILLDPTINKPNEKSNPINNSTLRGYEVIDEAKQAVENACPNTVSCSDILEFAARDAANILGGINYPVTAGRRDSVDSDFGEQFGFLPSPFLNLSALVDMFAIKGTTVEDMVVLSGAHSIGVAHCTAIDTKSRPTMDPNYADAVTDTCPTNTNNSTIPLDSTIPHKLDGKYYDNVMKNRGLLISDQVLMDSPATRSLVVKYAKHGGEWKRAYAKSVVRMDSIEVLLGDRGQVRKNCRSIN